MKAKGIILTAWVCLLFAPSSVLAHKVTVFAWIEGESVRTESKFSGGKKVNAGRIEVFDQQDRKILEGTTDDLGQFAFARPKDATALKIVLTAGMGHTNYWQILPEEISNGSTVQKPPAAAASVETEDEAHLDAETIEAIVERAVERKLAPLKAQLAQQTWGLRDIVAGLGYILGLMGLASYIHYRKAVE